MPAQPAQPPSTPQATTQQPPAVQSAAAVQPTPAPSEFSPEETETLKATYNALAADEQAEMVAYYADMDVDLLAALGLKAPPAVAMPLPDAVRALSFARQPAAVLAARSKLGFGREEMPSATDTAALAQWLHTRVLAGEWNAIEKVSERVPPNEAVDIYSHVLRSTNEGGGGLLPEEVLVLGDVCPGDMADWQLDVLSQLLRNASSRYGTGPFMDRIDEGTKNFGTADDAKRNRTLRLLIGAGMALEGHAFLPPLDEAQAAGDAQVIFAHGRYHEDLAASGRLGLESDEHLQQGWKLLGQVALMDGADTPLRTEAMRRAIGLLPNISPAPATEWLSEVFDNAALGPAALEIVALQAMTIRNQSVDAEMRAQSIATMKAAVETLLAKDDLDLASLRVPLRMLTMALADEVDAVVKEKGGIKGVAPETLLLLRASPDERWLSALEPSVATRGYRAAMDIATIADETDMALDVLANAVRHYPAAGVDMADEFLKLWQKRLNPQDRPGDPMYYFYYYGPQRLPSAPLTRGRQRRNLDRLERLLGILEEMGVHGRELPSVTSAFKACHAQTEVYTAEEITRVFGPLETIPGPTAAALAEAMRTGLGGDWRSRQTQQTYGMMRSQAEIADLVEEGYSLAIGLSDRALGIEPDSWRHAVLKAALSYDRVRFKQTQQKNSFSEFNDYRKQAFAAFEQASYHYADLVARGVERDSSGVYLQWFSAVLDAGQPVENDDDAEAAEERAMNDDQIARIARAMKALPADAYERHVADFSRDLISALSGAPPERKPSIVRASVRIVGDHPAGAALHRLNELYEDLVSDEIRLRLTIDGSDAVGSGLFALTLTLRYTNSVDRETGGFDKYLYDEAYVRIGNSFRMVNYQAQLRRSIESALSRQFTVESLGFFEPLTPSREVREEGQLDWQEKPLAYILLEANDPSVDRIPQISFDMHFDDQLGPVTLPILSNAPPIDATAEAALRPVKDLHVDQIVDLRRLTLGTDDEAVTIEVYAKGEGVIPELTDLLDGLNDALPGYSLSEEDMEARPYSVIQTDDGQDRFYMRGPAPEDKEFAKADENGIFRLDTERSWMVTLRPASASIGKALVLPKLAQGVEGNLLSKQYADMDIVEVQQASILVDPRRPLWIWMLASLAALAVVFAASWIVLRRRRPGAETDERFALPSRITPLSTIAALERIDRQGQPLTDDERRSLSEEIAAMERACFGPQNGNARPDEAQMAAILERWCAAARR